MATNKCTTVVKTPNLTPSTPSLTWKTTSRAPNGRKTKRDVVKRCKSRVGSVVFVGCEPWMTTVQPVAATAAAAVAARSIYHRSGRGEWSEPEEGERKDLRTPTKHGYPNDSIMHWIHSVTAYQRNCKSPSWPGMFFFFCTEKISMLKKPSQLMICFKQQWSQSASVRAQNVSPGWWCANVSLAAFIHCGFIENQCTKITIVGSLPPSASPPWSYTTAYVFCLFPSMTTAQFNGSQTGVRGPFKDLLILGYWSPVLSGLKLTSQISLHIYLKLALEQRLFRPHDYCAVFWQFSHWQETDNKNWFYVSKCLTMVSLIQVGNL